MKSNLLKNAKHNSLQMQFSSAYKQSYGIDDKKERKKKGEKPAAVQSRGEYNMWKRRGHREEEVEAKGKGSLVQRAASLKEMRAMSKC